jgi:hypothetical protein
MIASDLIKHFSHQIKLPVDVNDVNNYIKENNGGDDIQFIGVDIDPDILQGQIKVFHVRDGVYGANLTRCVNIYYHRGHSLDWQRFICCKELIHSLDPASAQTTSTEQIDNLAEKIGLPKEMQDPMSDGIETNVDRLAEYRAAAILLPWKARELLMPLYKAREITLADIARFADIPRKYVGFVMNDVWERLHPLLINDIR